jgi:hypothetical protein
MNTTTNDDANEKIIITLSERAPVKISIKDWPIVARSDWHDGKEFESQAFRRAEIRVREHRDGRRIAYGWATSQWQGERDQYAGFLLDKGDDAVRAIRRVAGAIGHHEIADECIGDLPAEAI